jgi:virulence-associated protein VapD
MDEELKLLEKLFHQCQKDHGPKRIRYMKFINLTYDLETDEEETFRILEKLEEKGYVKLKLNIVGELKSAELTRKGLIYFIEHLDDYKKIETKISKTIYESETELSNYLIYEKTGIDICTINAILHKQQYQREKGTGYLNYKETMNNYQIFNIQIEPSRIEEYEKVINNL